ncbi:vitamin B12 ABC transporter, ATP-binding protein [Escherichia coli]|nr:vitamin B12 ABC transporter, ATP-binding protein [Escherichia coli]
MSIVMQLQDVAESTRLGPLSGEVRAGEILHLVGPNGAGKSTLLARMAGMTSGKGSIQFAGNHWKHGPQQNSRCIAPIFHNSRRRRLQCRSGTI